MKGSEETDQILLEYLDGTLDEKRKQQIEGMIRQHQEIKVRLEELKTISLLLQKTIVDEPPRNFTDVVMKGLDQYPESKSYSVKNGLLVLFGVLTVSLLAVLLVASGVFDDSISKLDLSTIGALKNLRTGLPVLMISTKLIVNVIIFLNLVLAWLVLDRAILRPWFDRRLNAQD